MKKFCSFLLIFAMLSCFIVTPAVAADFVSLGASDHISLSVGQSYPADKEIQLYQNGTAGYRPDLGSDICDMVRVHVRTGASEAGIVELRLNSTGGELLGQFDVRELSPLDWATIHKVEIGLTTPMRNGDVLYLVNRGMTQSFHMVEFSRVDPSSFKRKIADLSDIDLYDDISADNNRCEINLMAQLGAFDTDDKNFTPNTPMTRRELMTTLGQLINSEQYAGELNPFGDIAPEEPDYAVLNGLYYMGIIRGGIDGNLYPNSFITIDQLASIFVSALGYRVIPNSDINALSIAVRLKLFEGIDRSDKYINRSEAAKFLYNLFTADYLSESSISAEGVTYEETSNFLEKTTELIFGTGVVNGNYDTTLYYPRDDEDNILIEDITFGVGTTAAVNYLGINCEYFYKENDGKKELCAIFPSPDTKIDIFASSDDIYFETINDKEIVVGFDDDDEEEYKLSTTTAIIYNGVALDRSLSTLVNEDNFAGAITIINNDGDRTVDCVWIDHATPVIVGAVSGSKIYDEITNKTIDLTNDIVVVEGNGVSKQLSSLKKNDVITLYRSVNKNGNKLARIESTQRKVNGEISEISNGRPVIDGVEFEISNVCKDDIYVGLKADFALDRYGFVVAAFEYKQSDAGVGLYMDVSYDVSGFDDDIKLKLLTENSGVMIFDFADRVTIDGVSVKESADIYSGYGKYVGFDDVAKNTPVLYKLDATGKICMIDTIMPGAATQEDNISQLGEGKNWLQLSNLLVDEDWKNCHPIRSNVKLIMMTSDGNEDNYGMKEGFYAENDIRVFAVPYTVNRESMMTDILVATTYSASVNRKSAPFVFKSVASALDENGDAVKTIRGISSDSADVSYVLDDNYIGELSATISKLREGDLIWPKLTNGRVTELQLVCTPDMETTNAGGLTTLVNSSTELGSDFVYAPVTKVEDGFIKFELSDGTYDLYALNASMAVVSTEGNGKYEVRINESPNTIFEGTKVVGYVEGRYIRSIFLYDGTLTE